MRKKWIVKQNYEMFTFKNNTLQVLKTLHIVILSAEIVRTSYLKILNQNLKPIKKSDWHKVYMSDTNVVKYSFYLIYLLFFLTCFYNKF